MVVDCSGRQTFLGNQLKLKIRIRFSISIIHWFDGYDRKVFAKRHESGLHYIFPADFQHLIC